MERKNRVYIDNSEKIPVKEKIFYGIGGLMDGGGVTLMSCVMLKYLTQVGGIAVGIASSIITVAKIWDAVTDPLMGFISDNTRSRFGRRKPYMIFGGISLIFAIFLLFMPVRSWGVSVGGMIPYMLVMYLLWNTCSTITQVPYCSMSSDISPSFKERNSANTVKLIFTSVASGLAYVVPLFFVEALIRPDGYLFMPNLSPTAFWLLMSIIFGSLFGGGLILCGIFVKERARIPETKEKFSLKRFFLNYIEPYKNKSYRYHILMYVSAFTCMDIISALAVFYATDVWYGYSLWGMEVSSLFIIAPMMISCVLVFPIARVVMDKKSKQFAFRMGLPFYIAGGILLAVIDPSWASPVLIPVASIIMGLGFGGAQMMPWIIFPDTVDVGYFATGKKQAGTYSGMMTLVRKVGGAFGVGLVGWILGWAGYKENTSSDPSTHVLQSDGVLLAIRLVFGISIAILISIALISSFAYKVDNKKLERVLFFINAQENNQRLTSDEQNEKQELITALYGTVSVDDFETNDIEKDLTETPNENSAENLDGNNNE